VNLAASGVSSTLWSIESSIQVFC